MWMNERMEINIIDGGHARWSKEEAAEAHEGGGERSIFISVSIFVIASLD